MAMKYKLNRKKVLAELERLGFTQSFVAELLGMTKQNFSQMLKGKQGTTDKNLDKLAKILSLSIDEMIK